ncbi:TetR/AcrR family transcriptional regulator [Isoptericola sp. F-RaC21]|uniref:TetR/AcrR family transcriptional regulator n=1 Tax=Isoptericola sp. F-RaC21 TaxID=3141452 RepID=UPI00315B5C6E
MPRPPRIGTDAIVNTALALLDEQGTAALTMRHLAARLQVRAPSLYHHVAGKAELQQLVADSVWAEVFAGLGTDLAWRPLLEGFARRARRALRAHPGAAQVLAVTNVSEATYRPVVPVVTRAFEAVGTDPQEALHLVSSLGVLVTGLALAEFGDAPNPPVAPRDYYDHWFELAVGTFLDGVAARHETGS